MCSTTQLLSQQQSSKQVSIKKYYKDKIKAKPQYITELDYSRVWVKVNGHPVVALVDLEATSGDFIYTQFVHLYGLHK